jgi:hypothetical protein
MAGNAVLAVPSVGLPGPAPPGTCPAAAGGRGSGPALTVPDLADPASVPDQLGPPKTSSEAQRKPIAPSGVPGTDKAMTHGLETHTRTSHTTDGIRSSSHPLPSTLLPEPAGAVVVELRHPTLRPARDGATRRAGHPRPVHRSGVQVVQSVHRVCREALLEVRGQSSDSRCDAALKVPCGLPTRSRRRRASAAIAQGRGDVVGVLVVVQHVGQPCLTPVPYPTHLSAEDPTASHRSARLANESRTARRPSLATPVESSSR